MDTRETIAFRIRQLCKERKLTPNDISNIAGIPQATVKSILNGESKNPGTVTIKKLCDGFEITLGELLKIFLFMNPFIYSRSRNFVMFSNISNGHGAFIIRLLVEVEIFRTFFLIAPFVFTGGFSELNAFALTLQNKFALKFGNCSKNGQHKFALRSGKIDLLL